MPIRTNRGRAAVYRRLWGWPLRSPRHLIASLIGVAALVALIAVVAAHLKVPSTTKSATAGASSSVQPAGGQPATSGTAGPTVTTPAQTRLLTPPETPSSAPAPTQALGVITQWGRAWVNHPVGITSQQWLDQLKPYTDPEFLATSMSSVDPANIVATAVIGAPQVVSSFTDRVEATLPTNGGPLDVSVVSTPQGWLVNAYNGGS